MASDITITSGGNSTPPAGTVIETIQQTGGEHIQIVLGGSGSITTREWTFSTGQNDTLLLSATSSERIGITRVAVTNDQASTGNPAYRLGFTTTATLPASSSSGVAGMISSHPGLTAGGGVIEGTGAGLIALGDADAEVRFTCESPGGTLRIIITSFIFPV